MTKKPVDVDNEACRKLMSTLFDGEEEAQTVAKALLRSTTPEEDRQIEQAYKAADEAARVALAEIDVSRKLEAAGRDEVSSFTNLDEERDFDSFMQSVYREAERRQVAAEHVSGQFRPAVVFVSGKRGVQTQAGKDRVAERRSPPTETRTERYRLPLAAAEEVRTPEGELRVPKRLDDIWINGNLHQLLMDEMSGKILVAPAIPAFKTLKLLGSMYDLEMTTDGLFSEIVDLQHGDVVDVIESYCDSSRSAQAS